MITPDECDFIRNKLEGEDLYNFNKTVALLINYQLVLQSVEEKLGRGDKIEEALIEFDLLKDYRS